MYCLGSQKPSATAGWGYADVAVEFEPFMRFSIADAFRMGFMDAVTLVFIDSLLGGNAIYC
jgi:hypothetical protein